MKRWRDSKIIRRLITLPAVTLTLVASLFVVAPDASAYCQGARGCDSGWSSTTAYYVSSHTNVNADVHWTADAYNTRTFYFSGSNCSFSGACVRLQEERLYYRVHPSGGWILIASYIPGPSVGTYSYRVFNGWSTPRDFVSAGRDQYGHWVNSPVIYN